MFRSSREPPPPPPSPADMTRRSFSRMASRKPDTQWVHFRCVQGQRSRTWGPYLSAPARVIHASCSMGPLWPITRSMACNTGISHQECTICSFAVSLSTSQVYRCPLFPCFPLISTVSLITGAIRATRVISAYARTPLSRARSIRSLLRSRWDSTGTSRDPRRFPSSSFTAIANTPKERRACDEELGESCSSWVRLTFFPFVDDSFLHH